MRPARDYLNMVYTHNADTFPYYPAATLPGEKSSCLSPDHFPVP